MNRKHLTYYLLILSLFITIPIVIEYKWNIPSGSGDWLGFWGSYLGIIPAGLIAYFIARYQIEREHELMRKEKEKEYQIMLEEKNKEYLPYFNIKNNQLIFSAMRENLPIQQVQLFFYDEKDELINAGEAFHFGHLFPNKYIDLPLKGDKYSRLDVVCTLVNAQDIFYTYGNGVQGAHFCTDAEGEFESYVFERTVKSQSLAYHRMNKIKTK